MTSSSMSAMSVSSETQELLSSCVRNSKARQISDNPEFCVEKYPTHYPAKHIHVHTMRMLA
jgi:hypothetical protein